MTIRILVGDCRETLKSLPDASVDSVVCDPPYHLTSIVKRFGSETAAPAKVGKTGAYARASKGFMGQTWDGGDVAFQAETWAEVLRVLKPGGHLVAFSGTRTYHRMAVAIEDAGFEVRDQLAWVYGSGFPKSLDVSKAIDKAAGAERAAPQVVAMAKSSAVGEISKNQRCALCGKARVSGNPCTCPRPENYPATDEARQWQGWGTALKPAWEPICLARKPLRGTVAANVLAHGTGALNIDGCRIGTETRTNSSKANQLRVGISSGMTKGTETVTHDHGRWPANICHDGSDEVVAGFPDVTPATSRTRSNKQGVTSFGAGNNLNIYEDATESAARFFYCAKTTTEERGEGNNHPTVKPQALMRWLCRLVTPPGGTVLDPFAGSGSTLIAADAEQFHAIGCELSPEYAAIAERRLRDAGGMFCDVSVAA